ncbi:MAG: hypothetical protein QOG64_1161, partial [Acidimicrobiaceae bacterium]|nr:hypothetical protein [Acidimicrobiaceae bacterium]
MTWLRRLVLDVAPLREREVRLLWLARGVSFFGSMVTFVAVPFQMYRLTGSTAAVGLVGLVELAAILGLAFVGGAMADGKDRRRIVLVTEAALLCTSLALAGNAALARPSVIALFLLAGAMAGLDALQRPSLEAMLPMLVGPEQMPALSALFSIEGTVGMIAGPALGGVLIATVGASAAFLFDAGTFVASIALLAALAAPRRRDGAERPSWRGVVEGLRYARGRQDLLGTYIVDFVAMVFGMPMALFPAVADEIGGPRTLGLLYAAPALGALLASVGSGWTSRVGRHGVAISISATVWGAGIVAFGFSRALLPALAGLVVAGGADMVSGLFRMTLWNQTIPERLRGRLASIELISYSSGPALGNAEAGLAGSVFGLPAAI